MKGVYEGEGYREESMRTDALVGRYVMRVRIVEDWCGSGGWVICMR